MRKLLILPALILITAYVISGCSTQSTRGKELVDNAPSYMHIAEYADANLRTEEYSTSKDHYMVMLSDIADIDEISSDVKVAMQDYTYFWIENSYVQFWNDETKTEGILCTFDSDKGLKELKSWYDGVQTEKLADNCYRVYPPRGWIG